MPTLTPVIDIDNNNPFFTILDSQEMIECFKKGEYGVGTVIFGWVANEDSRNVGFGYPLRVTAHGDKTITGKQMSAYWIKLEFLDTDPLAN